MSMIKILGALDNRGSQLSYALRFNSISNFLASISSFEIMPISEILAFFSWKTEQTSREIIRFQSKISPRENSIWTWIKVRWKFGRFLVLCCQYWTLDHSNRPFFMSSLSLPEPTISYRNLGLKIPEFHYPEETDCSSKLVCQHVYFV